MTSRVRAQPAGDYDYEAGGAGYALERRPDPRIAARVHAALGDARTVLNVGAGAGSYEPSDRYVLAVEPSASMRAQRPPDAAPALDATAERLPFDDGSFDAAMASITIHQWADVDAGLREMRRVARGPVVLLTFDTEVMPRFWLYEYVPELIQLDAGRFPTIERVSRVLGGDVSVEPVPLPRDCTDGFIEPYYARPEALLDPDVRRAQSGWGLLPPDVVERGLGRLREALDSGEWDARFGYLREQEEHIGSVVLVVARPGKPQ